MKKISAILIAAIAASGITTGVAAKELKVANRMPVQITKSEMKPGKLQRKPGKNVAEKERRMALAQERGLKKNAMPVSAMRKAPTRASMTEVEFFDETFACLTEGSIESPVKIETDYYANIPESIIGEENYGFGGIGIYQAGGSLFTAYEDYYDYGEGPELTFAYCWTPDVFGPGVYTISFDVMSDVADGEVVVEFSNLNEGGIDLDWEEGLSNEEFQHVSFTFDALAESADAQLYFILYGSDIAENGIYVKNVKITGELPNVSAPVALDYSDFTGTSFTANWEAVEGAVAYNLYVAAFNPYDQSFYEPYFLDGEKVTETSYVVEDIEPGVVYFYWVTAENEDGDVSPKSEEIEVATLLPVENLRGTVADDQKSVRVNWDAVPGANLYLVDAMKLHQAYTEEDVTLLNADFSDTVSEGTVESPEELDSVIDYFDQMPGWMFILPATVNGAVGIVDDYIYAWFGYAASIQSGTYNLSGMKDGKVNVKMTAASGMGNNFAMGLFTNSEETGQYEMMDLFITEEPMSDEFTEYEFSLEGCGEESIFVIMTDTTPIDGADGNLFIRNLEISGTIEADGMIGVPYSTLQTQLPMATFEGEFTTSDGLAVAVQPYTLDDEDYVYIEGPTGEYVTVVEITGVESIADDNMSGTTRYYNLQGLEINQPVKGEVFIQVKGGKATKAIRK